MSSNIKCQLLTPVDPHVRAIFIVDEHIKFELRLAFKAILDVGCGLGGIDSFNQLFDAEQKEKTVVYQWISKTGEQLLEKVKEPEIVIINETNVSNGDLTTPLEGLLREPLDINNIPR
ncbi:hypothetical protein NSS90_06525 [Bacillus sp. PS93]|uniref:hypothetical protein n=1 Tax=unclassified Bacillus (in: firmicutes) TaxID=185979 RepID=UPI0030D3DDF7